MNIPKHKKKIKHNDMLANLMNSFSESTLSYFVLKTGRLAISEDPDERPHQGLHCLLRYK